MKTAISLPNHLHQAADQLAEQLGISRSELYQRALARYIAEYRDEGTTVALNAIYRDEGQSGLLETAWELAQTETLGNDEW
jgi:metal-responsive CopG/Arc/MetJ family transcriptional regulator|nr:hypothetical protein [Candidatus Krumholzibacteria bacterium]